MNSNNDQMKPCSSKEGALPKCAPLAMSYVPMQESASPSYEPNQALLRGTLFPGLDLPFMNVVNKGKLTGTPMGEIMAIDFVIKELNLYLDTHKNDAEAFQTLQTMLSLYDEGKAKYVKRFSPLTIYDLKNAENFSWICDPWPWDYHEGMED